MQGDEQVLATYSKTAQRDQQVNRLRQLLAGGFDIQFMVVGQNWTICCTSNKATAIALMEMLAGNIVSIAAEASSSDNSAADGLEAAKTACSSFKLGVAPVIHDAVQQNNGALLIRIANGQPPQGGPIDEFAPYFTMNNAAINAAGYDSKYQGLNDAVNSMNSAIDEIDSGHMTESLAKVADVATVISRICSSVR